MGKPRFTEEQRVDFLSQVRNGMSDNVLCERYNLSISTLRRWKEQHDKVISNQLKKMESISVTIFFGIVFVGVMLTYLFSNITGDFCIPVMLGYCIFYIIQFRKKTDEFILCEYKFIARSGLGVNNAFYLFSWISVCFFIFMLIYGVINILLLRHYS